MIHQRDCVKNDNNIQILIIVKTFFFYKISVWQMEIIFKEIWFVCNYKIEVCYNPV